MLFLDDDVGRKGLLELGYTLVEMCEESDQKNVAIGCKILKAS